MFKSSWPGEWHDSDIMSGRIRRKLKIRSGSNNIFFERVTLRRRDGLEIPVARTSGHMFQLAYLDNGMEMIWVVKLLQKSCEPKICAHYYRVLRTSDAIRESLEEHDLDLGGGLVHLGTSSLRKLLAQEIHYPENFRGRTFHWGNVLHQTDIGNIVDVVDWMTTEDIIENRLDMFMRWKKVDEKANQGAWVLCGKPFNERDPVQD